MDLNKMILEDNEKERGININTVYDGFDDSSFYDWMRENFSGMYNGMLSRVLENIFEYARKHCKGKDKLAHFVHDMMTDEIRFCEVARFCTNDILSKKTIKMLDSVCFDPDSEEAQATVDSIECAESPDGMPCPSYCVYGEDYFMENCVVYDGGACKECHYHKITEVENIYYKPYYKDVKLE